MMKYDIKNHGGLFFMFLIKEFFIRGVLSMFLKKGFFLAKGRKKVSGYCFDDSPLLIANAVD